MGYQPRAKSPRGAAHGYAKSYRQKSKRERHIRRNTMQEEAHTTTEKEVIEVTLKRLHTLGIQRFGSSPFSEHFDLWLSNVEAVVAEFESYPTIRVDEQFAKERSQVLSTIKLRLEERRRKEAVIGQEIKNLSDCRIRLKQVNKEYSVKRNTLKARRKSQLKRLYAAIDNLKAEQQRIIQLKAGFLRRVSRKEKERLEVTVVEELNSKQREVDLVFLEFDAALKKLWQEFEQRRQPVWEQLKVFQKRVDSLELDGSLEERWFACEALIDAVNSFLQRRAAQPKSPA